MKWKYFKLEEFECKYTGMNKINHELIDMLDEAREIAGVPMIVSSGYRHETHPESFKNPSSSHIKGLAVDIKCVDSKSRAIILGALVDVGFERFGLHKGFIHADIDQAKASPVIWLY